VNCNVPAPNLWVKAAPGVGKSVLCAYAIQQVADLYPDRCAIFQYYTFDDEFSALQVYRSLAEQLANRLWVQIADMPEDIHAYTQRSTTSSKSEDVKEVTRMLLNRMTATYIFLDGLDEECDNGPRWSQLAEVLDFLMELTNEKPQQVRVWYSCQDRKCLDTRLKDFPVIEVTKSLNTSDMELYLLLGMKKLESLDLDEGYQTLVKKDLHQKANGCFLWTSLMLDWVSSAPTLHEVQKRINDGLPKNYEEYYQKKIESIDISQRSFVS
jgi:hypothetical protein